MIKRDRVKIHEAVQGGDFSELNKLEWSSDEWEEFVEDIRTKQVSECTDSCKAVLRQAIVVLMDAIDQ